MTKQKIFGVLAGGLFIACALAMLPAEAQGPQAGPLLQLALRQEMEARDTNTAASWYSAGESWKGNASGLAMNENHQDWVKDSLNPAMHDISVAALKRSLACYVKSYDLEGVHDTPASRARSNALRGISTAYLELIKIDPKNSSWYYLYGEAQSGQGLYKQATPYLKKAVALGGAGGTKASALMAHSHTYLAHQLANDQALWNHNEAADKYNAAHYHPTTSHRIGAGGMYSQISGYQANHQQTSTGHW